MNAAATKLPTEMGPIHFVGIGGIGMSGIAEVLLNHGYTVQGSDQKRSKITDRLEKLGATIFEGQAAENLADAEVACVCDVDERRRMEVAASVQQAGGATPKTMSESRQSMWVASDCRNRVVRMSRLRGSQEPTRRSIM